MGTLDRRGNGRLVIPSFLGLARSPESQLLRPVLEGFGQVLGGDPLLVGQIGNGASQLQHPMIGAARGLQLPRSDLA